MDLLRWILLAVGALVVVGVYWWSRRNAREEEQFFRTEPGVGGADDEYDPLFASSSRAGSRHTHTSVLTTDSGEPDLEAVHRELSSLQALLQAEDDAARQPRATGQSTDFQLSLDAAMDDAIKDEPVGAAPQEKLVVLYLVAHPNQVFSASAIGESLRDLGLDFGDMHIYHRYPDEGGDVPVFGVANLVEPGTLEPEALAETGTPGLTLFLQLPGPMPPLTAFDLFASTAQQLAVRLNGELRDKNRTMVSRQMLEHLRDEIQQYARRLHLQTHS